MGACRVREEESWGLLGKAVAMGRWMHWGVLPPVAQQTPAREWVGLALGPAGCGAVPEGGRQHCCGGRAQPGAGVGHCPGSR